MTEYLLIATSEAMMEQFNQFNESNYKQGHKIQDRYFDELMSEIGRFNRHVGVESVVLVKMVDDIRRHKK